jgi:tRNA-splicing ligase RtcB
MPQKIIFREDKSRPVRIWTEDIEPGALKQLKNLARLPFIDRHGIAAMPDVHEGKGSTIGSVIATDKAIIPAAVGVDIGCGMNAIRLSLNASDLPDHLGVIRSRIEDVVPLGAGGAHHELSQNFNVVLLEKRFKGIVEKNPVLGRNHRWAQIGTLGSGNHFIELCLDESKQVWIMLHSGSRGVGNLIGKYFISKAKRHMERYFIALPDGDLAYFPEGEEDFNAYVEAVSWAQDYAFLNRQLMLEAVIRVLREEIKKPFELTTEAINCHHNYVEREEHFGRNLWVTRKGAIRAGVGELGIIPGSMGQKSYIVRGKGNTDSYCSCSHGAGRRMSRTEARREFSVADLIAQTKGIECRKDDAVLDEIPASYKDIEKVMANQVDLVEVVHILRQVLCVKGA